MGLPHSHHIWAARGWEGKVPKVPETGPALYVRKEGKKRWHLFLCLFAFNIFLDIYIAEEQWHRQETVKTYGNKPDLNQTFMHNSFFSILISKLSKSILMRTLYTTVPFFIGHSLTSMQINLTLYMCSKAMTTEFTIYVCSNGKIFHF